MEPKEPVSERFPRMPEAPRKRKWAAGLLSALIPGLGHMYTGAMHRGLFFMLLFTGNIFGVVLVSIEGIVPLIVLLAVLIPVVYFYALFDALQTTDRMNAWQLTPGAPTQWVPGSIGAGKVGIGLVAVGFLFFWVRNEPEWITDLMNGNSPLFASVLLIGAGAFIFLTGRKGK